MCSVIDSFDSKLFRTDKTILNLNNDPSAGTLSVGFYNCTDHRFPTLKWTNIIILSWPEIKRGDFRRIWQYFLQTADINKWKTVS